MNPRRKQWLKAVAGLLAVVIVAGALGWLLGARHHRAAVPPLRALQVPVQTVQEGTLPGAVEIPGLTATTRSGA